MQSIVQRILIVSIAFMMVCGIIAGPLRQSVSAVSMSDFDPSNIIDDAVFYDANSMSASQIQSFLNSKVPTCDTQGALPYLNTGQTVSQYWTPRGEPGPYTCLKDYSQKTPSMPANSVCSSIPAYTNRTAAQIIADVSTACGISPKVMLVLLQKEQYLVTDTSPLHNLQYGNATGFACPDNAPCDPAYDGFYYQVYYAAHQYDLYKANPTSYNYIAGQSNRIYYNPDPSCGSSWVTIKNQATAGLYDYTPYQPNAATKSVGLGVTAPCGAYGNKNFWWYFTSWFGSTQKVNLPGCAAATNTSLACVWELQNAVTNQNTFTTSYTNAVNLLNNQGYYLEGMLFYGNNSIAPQPGNVPVYQLTSSTGAAFLTISASERASLLQSGYTDNGIAFYADPAGANSGYPVYRLYSSSTNTHIWTGSASVRDGLLANGYTSEGIAFNSITTIRQETPPATGQSLVYRFYMPTGEHFWTTGLYERDSMIRSGYDYEGVAWSVPSNATSTPVYRLYSPTMKTHLFTADANEKNTLDRTSSWNYEGIAYYASATPTAKPIYRLYSPITHNHLLTADANEKNTLVRRGTFRYEGIAYYAY